jgi:parallel beta-helix repeat protein
MERRTFLTLMGLGLLGSLSPIACRKADLFEIAAILKQTRHKSPLDSSVKKSRVSILAKLQSESTLLFIAPNGNDSWSGKQDNPNANNTDGPLATIEGAQDCIRQLKLEQGGILKQSVTVLVRSGTYFLEKPLVFTPEDSGTENCPITYQAYPQEKPIISGGIPIKNWEKEGNLWVATLPQLTTGQTNFRLLRVEEDWAIPARYPNYDPNNPLKEGWLFTKSANKSWETGTFDRGVARIHHPGDSLEWDIIVPATGKYKVWIRYAQNMKAYGIDSLDGRTAIFIKNTNPVPLVNLPDTGSFSSFQWAQAATISMQAGKQTLIWKNIKGGGIHLDAFCLTDDPNWNPNISLTQDYNFKAQTEKHLLLIQAEASTKVIGKEVTVAHTKSISDTGNIIKLDSEQFPNWNNWEGAEVNIFLGEDWANAILPITKIDQQSNTLYVSSTKDIRAGNRFFITNVLEALDTLGEWFLDRNQGKVFYWSISPDPNQLEIVTPILDKLLILQGNLEKEIFVEYLNFQGLTFTDSDYTLADNYYLPADAAIWLSTVRNCSIQNCNFTRLGGYAIRLEQSSQKNYILNNYISNLGQGGVVFLGDKSNQPINNLIAANNIQDCGQIYKHIAGVYVTTGSNNLIVHNYISRMPRYGISLKSYDLNNYSHNNLIEFNEIIDTNLETSDTGAIETLGRDKQLSGNIIRFNLIRNVVGLRTTFDGQIVSPDYTWGIYLDDYSSGTTIYGNIVVNTVRGGVHIHGGKNNLIENNIFVNGAEQQIQLSPKDNFMTNNKIDRNIFCYDQSQAILRSNNQKIGFSDRLVESNHNLYWNTSNLDLTQTQKTITPEGNFRQWQAAGFDSNSIVADPQFVALDKGDLRLLKTSPAWKLGFQPIPIEKIGIDAFNRRDYPDV